MDIEIDIDKYLKDGERIVLQPIEFVRTKFADDQLKAGAIRLTESGIKVAVNKIQSYADQAVYDPALSSGLDTKTRKAIEDGKQELDAALSALVTAIPRMTLDLFNHYALVEMAEGKKLAEASTLEFRLPPQKVAHSKLDISLFKTNLKLGLDNIAKFKSLDPMQAIESLTMEPTVEWELSYGSVSCGAKFQFSYELLGKDSGQVGWEVNLTLLKIKW